MASLPLPIQPDADVLCPHCGWEGQARDCDARPSDLLRCPTCNAPVLKREFSEPRPDHVVLLPNPI